MIDKIKIKLLESPEWMISLSVFIIYWFVSKSYTAPTVLSDEIGYLANAALISGHRIDGASQYHAGYSFFLAPLFLVFSKTSQIWQAAMVLNAFIWSISFFVLARVLRKLMPEHSKRQLVFALLISAVYPAWITMSGYVFATTAFVLIYLLSILSLLFWKPKQYWTIIPHSVFVGYLYWIHPVGLAVCGASLIVVGLASVKEHRYISALLNTFLLLLLIFFYNIIVHEWLILLATPEGYTPLSFYPDSEGLLERISNYDFWMHFAAKSAGHISYLIVSSFGLIYLGFIASINKSYPLLQKTEKEDDHGSASVHRSVFAFFPLTLLGVLLMGVMLFSGTESRLDQWIYGRYSEMVVFPLLVIGYLSLWNNKRLILAVFFVLISGVIINQLADLTAYNYLIMTVAFWPQYVIEETNFIYWMTAGAVALVLVGKLKSYNKLANLLATVFILLVFILSSVVQGYIHNNSSLVYGKPSAFVETIRSNYPPGTCVGFNPVYIKSLDVFTRYQYHLNLFYLYDYAYRRMTPEEWLENCSGPYFDYELGGLYEKQGVKLIGKEVYTKLYLLTKEDGSEIVMPDKSGPIRNIYTATNWSIDYQLKSEGVQLVDMVGHVGYYENDSVYSTGDEGFLLMAPGIRLGPGKYNFVLHGEVSAASGSWVEIVSRGGRVEHGKFNIDFKENFESDNTVIAIGNFLLDNPSRNLEVKVYTSSSDEIRIDGFMIEFIEETEEPGGPCL